MVARGMIRISAMGLSVLALTACGGSTVVPPRTPTPSAPLPVVRPIDQCGAASLQSLIGQPRTEIPVPVDVTSRRVTCTECPLTEDYSASRLNILFNRDTGLVERVYCG